MTLTTLLFASWLFAPALPAQETPSTPSFSGSWEKDPERSDDAEAKMKAAFEQMREQRGGMRPGGGGMPPGEGPPGGGGRRPGGERRGMGGGGPGMRQIPDHIDLDLEGNEVHLDDGERVQIYYLDGEKHLRELPNGTKLETVTVLQGNVIHIREKLDRGNVDRKLELSPDGDTLVATLTMKMGNMKDPVVIRTVYARATAENF